VTTKTDADELVVFVHVPKTAGMTMRALFRRMYGSEAVFTARNKPGRLADPTPLVEMPVSDLARYRAVVGHLPFGIHELIARPVRYITFLRAPVERTVSDYYYGLRNSAPDAAIRKLSMLEYLARGDLANLQTRMIGGTIAGRDKAADETDLARGKQRLDEDFAAVGVLEHFDESVMLIGEALGWRYFLHRRENVAPDPPRVEVLDREVLHVIEQINELDLELYHHAATLLGAVLARRGRGFATRAQAIRLASQGSEALLRSPLGGAARWGWRRLRRFAVRDRDSVSE